MKIVLTITPRDGDTYERAYPVGSLTVGQMFTDLYRLAGMPEDFSATIETRKEA